MLTRGDLHIHSTASDGELSPREIVVSAMQRGIDTIAIADHNSTEGINEAAAAGRQYGVSVIPAVEVSTKYMGEPVHVLGYFRDGSFNHGTLREILRLVKTHRLNEARSILRGFLHTDDSGGHLSVSEGIALLRIFKAAVVLAHPVRISTNNLTALLSMPFDGIEARYCNVSSDDTRYFINTALSRFQFYTGGSDFHAFSGGPKTHCPIGNPCLNSMELQMFIRNSGAVILN